MDVEKIKAKAESRAMRFLDYGLDKIETMAEDKLEDKTFRMSLTSLKTLLEKLKRTVKSMRGGRFMLEKRFSDFVLQRLTQYYFVLETGTSDNETVELIRTNIMNELGGLVDKVTQVMRAKPKGTGIFGKRQKITDDEIKTHRAKILLEAVPKWKAELEAFIEDEIDLIDTALAMRAERPLLSGGRTDERQNDDLP